MVIWSPWTLSRRKCMRLSSILLNHFSRKCVIGKFSFWAASNLIYKKYEEISLFIVSTLSFASWMISQKYIFFRQCLFCKNYEYKLNVTFCSICDSNLKGIKLYTKKYIWEGMKAICSWKTFMIHKKIP